jgi:hypothetical protein
MTPVAQLEEETQRTLVTVPAVKVTTLCWVLRAKRYDQSRWMKVQKGTYLVPKV